MENGGAISRIEAKLRQKLDASDFYEGHQLYRTLYFRYAAQGKFGELLHLLYDGSIYLLTKGQLASGIDLAILFVDVLNKHMEKKLDDTLVCKLESMLKLMPAKDQTMNRDKFIQDAIKWSAAKLNNAHGSANLHAKFATVFWEQKDYVNARRHFMWSDDANSFSSFLVDYHTSCGNKDEYDLFIAQAVLQLLCRKNVSTAQSTFVQYLKKHPVLSQLSQTPPLATPLLDFICFLLESMQTSPRLQTFTVLVDKYQASLEKDPSYKQYVDKIGQLYFGLPAPPSRNGGFLANLITGLIKDDDDGEDDDEEDEKGGEQKKPREKHVESTKGSLVGAPTTTVPVEKRNLKEDELD